MGFSACALRVASAWLAGATSLFRSHRFLCADGLRRLGLGHKCGDVEQQHEHESSEEFFEGAAGKKKHSSHTCPDARTHNKNENQEPVHYYLRCIDGWVC